MKLGTKNGRGSPSAGPGVKVQAIENHADDVMKAVARCDQDRREAQEREAAERAVARPEVDEALAQLTEEQLARLYKETLRQASFGRGTPSEDDIRLAMFRRLKTYGAGYYGGPGQQAGAA